MHYILDRLRFEQPLSYSQMLPRDIESSLFQYHLKALLKDELIQKTDRGIYELTQKGYAALEYMSVNHDSVLMPKVITFTLLTQNKEYLLYRKPKEPYRHLLELVGGKIHVGERAELAAQRDIKEKTNLDIEPPQFCGVANIIVRSQNYVLTHMIAYIFTAEITASTTELSEHIVWVHDIDNRDDLAPSTLPLIQAIQHEHRPFAIDLDLTFSKK